MSQPGQDFERGQSMSLPAQALHIDPDSPVPPFEQLCRQIARLVADGELAPGAKLPTVRQLATDLGLAANTVARSYRKLEADGVLVTEGRRGTFVHRTLLDGEAAATIERLLRDLVLAARHAGLSAPETVRMLEQAWGSR
jgi:DNA-binding transcriptional regulator YhcF (GntR family)